MTSGVYLTLGLANIAAQFTLVVIDGPMVLSYALIVMFGVMTFLALTRKPARSRSDYPSAPPTSGPTCPACGESASHKGTCRYSMMNTGRFIPIDHVENDPED